MNSETFYLWYDVNNEARQITPRYPRAWIKISNSVTPFNLPHLPFSDVIAIASRSVMINKSPKVPAIELEVPK